jgi:uncharacterized phiE125 gp8 family phage protein
MALKLINPPATEPIALDEIENFLRISNEPDVTILTDMISAARKRVEAMTGRQLITATWELRLDSFPGMIKIPMPPLQSITFLKYLDTGGIEQDLTEDIDFIVDTYSEPARITPAYGTVWPLTQSVFNAVRLIFVAGYGDNDTDIPEPIRNYMKVFIGAMYENRELMALSNSPSALIKFDFLDGLLDEYRVYDFG